LKLDLSIFLQTLPDNAKKNLFLFILFQKGKKEIFLSKIAKIFFLSKPLAEIKNQQGIYPNGLINDWAEFPNSKEKSRKRFFCF